MDQLLTIEAECADIATSALYLCERRDEHAAGAYCRIVDAFTRLRFEHLCHQMHERPVSVELLSRVSAIVGELLDEIFIGVTELILGDRGEAERMLGEMFDQILERLVRHLSLIRPRSIAENAWQAFGIGRLDSAESVHQGTPHIPRGRTDVGPVRALGNGKSIISGCPGVGRILCFVQRGLILLIPDI